MRPLAASLIQTAYRYRLLSKYAPDNDIQMLHQLGKFKYYLKIF
jgi:hypothetical protein